MMSFMASVACTTVVEPSSDLQHQPPLPPPLTDLLAHRYRPTSIDKLECHREQAIEIKKLILNFTKAPKNDVRHGDYSETDSDYAESHGGRSDDSGDEEDSARRCILLTGAPGIGKTSLVYIVAKELGMHIVESHPSERRDFKLFKTLKLANQKGKINPIARLFQLTQQKQQQTLIQNLKRHPKRKRRKLEEVQEIPNASQKTSAPQNQCLSLSGNSSIVLFDDVDVVFDEDGPFLKSLAEFIRDSKRPVIVTATRYIELIKMALKHFDHIHLTKPAIDVCAKFLREVCRKEKFHKMNKVTNCRIIAKKMNCDIRQCLNRIQFYGNKATSNIDHDICDVQQMVPNFSRLSTILEQTITAKTDHSEVDDDATDIEENIHDDEATIIDTPLAYQQDATPTTLACYDLISHIDLMDSAFDLADRETLYTRWLEGKPSDRYFGQRCEHALNEQIRTSVDELIRKLHKTELTTNERPKPREATRHPKCFIGQRTKSELIKVLINTRPRRSRGDREQPCERCELCMSALEFFPG